MALGYTSSNCSELIKQIEDGFGVDRLVSKGFNQYGEKFEIIMDINGINGKKANVCTGWIRLFGSLEYSLTTAYVTKRRSGHEDKTI